MSTQVAITSDGFLHVQIAIIFVRVACGKAVVVAISTLRWDCVVAIAKVVRFGALSTRHCGEKGKSVMVLLFESIPPQPFCIQQWPLSASRAKCAKSQARGLQGGGARNHNKGGVSICCFCLR